MKNKSRLNRRKRSKRIQRKIEGASVVHIPLKLSGIDVSGRLILCVDEQMDVSDISIRVKTV